MQANVQNEQRWNKMKGAEEETTAEGDNQERMKDGEMRLVTGCHGETNQRAWLDSTAPDRDL